jgi:hypothetical protein
MTARRFPPPWTVEELNDACFVVRDANGQQLRSCLRRAPLERPTQQQLHQSIWCSCRIDACIKELEPF